MFARMIWRSMIGGRARFGVALAALAVPAALVTASANFVLDSDAKMTREFRRDAPNVLFEMPPGSGALGEPELRRALALLPGEALPDARSGSPRREVTALGTPEEIEAALARINASGGALRARIIPALAAKEAAVLGKLRSLFLFILTLIWLASAIAMGASLTAFVVERRVEIGLLKALGAPDSGVLKYLLAHVGLLVALGLAAGASAGVAISDVMSRGVFGLPSSFRPAAVGMAALSCVFLGALASLVPMRRALGVWPASVLKGE